MNGGSWEGAGVGCPSRAQFASAPGRRPSKDPGTRRKRYLSEVASSGDGLCPAPLIAGGLGNPVRFPICISGHPAPATPRPRGTSPRDARELRVRFFPVVGALRGTRLAARTGARGGCGGVVEVLQGACAG